MWESHKLKQKGIISQFLVVVLLLAGIVGGYFLLQYPQTFKSKAANSPIVAKTLTGTVLTPDVNNIIQITDPAIKLELTSPLGSAKVVSGSPSPSASSR